MNITVKNGNVITRNKNNSANNYDWVDYSFDGADYEYASASGDEYEYATGKKEETNKSTPNDKPVKVKKSFKDKAHGFGEKLGNAAKKVGKAFKNFAGNLKAKKAARKLKKGKDSSGKEVAKDLVPEVILGKNLNGKEVYQRTNPDGSITDFNKEDIEKGANGKLYAKEDLNKLGKNTIENGELVKIIPPEAIKELTTTDGEVIPFHKDDVIDKDAPDDGKPGMSTTKKILIGTGIAVGIALIIFTVYKLTKKK